MQKFDNCAICKQPVTLHKASEQFCRENPLGNHLLLECVEGCCNSGWVGRNEDALREEWNETQRVLLANEEAHRHG